MRFDGPEFARGWLAVATASSTARDAPPSTYKTVVVEEYLHSVRLFATDGFMLLTAPVLELGEDLHGPTIDQVPERTVIVSDADGLARQLLNHVLALARRIEKDSVYNFGDIEISIDFDVRVPAGSGDVAIDDGLEPTFAVLKVPDVERVHLPVIDTGAPDWRPAFHAFAGEETKQITLNPEFVERIGRVRRYAEGSLVWRFGGENRIALLDWPTSDPHIEGAVVPRRGKEDDKSTREGGES